jgi:hypothetical protein
VLTRAISLSLSLSVLLRGQWILDVSVNPAGSQNDINTLHASDLFKLFIDGAFKDHFSVGGEDFTMRYLFADGIYPSYAFLIKAMRHPHTPAEKRFNAAHEADRKAVERAIGCVQGRFKIIRKGNCNGFPGARATEQITKVCCLLHNAVLRTSLAWCLPSPPSRSDGRRGVVESVCHSLLGSFLALYPSEFHSCQQ